MVGVKGESSMQQWEYFGLFLNYYYDQWCDSSGREGTLVRHETEKQFVHTGGLADELGQQGWEQIGIETYPYRIWMQATASACRSPSGFSSASAGDCHGGHGLA
jgi:hypothetical protein